MKLLNQYTSREVPGFVNVIGMATNLATVTLWGDNGAFSATSRKGAYFRGELAVTNTVNPVWLTITNTAVLNNGSNPDIVTNTIGKTYVARTPEAFYYDLDGNLTNDGRWVYTWDAENRLVRLVANTAVGPQQRIDYDYDSKSRRISKKVWNNTTGSGLPNTYVNYVYDGWNLVTELAAFGGNSLLRDYGWGLDLSGSEQGAGGVGGLLLCRDTTTATTNYVAYDGNGNVTALVNAANGAVSAQYEPRLNMKKRTTLGVAILIAYIVCYFLTSRMSLVRNRQFGIVGFFYAPPCSPTTFAKSKFFQNVHEFGKTFFFPIWWLDHALGGPSYISAAPQVYQPHTPTPGGESK